MFQPHFVAAPSAAAPAWTAALTVYSTNMVISFFRRFFALDYYSLGSALDANGI